MIQFNYDLFVIGGGSGGLSAAKAAADLGAKVGLADFVKPSPLGTKWGIGGTCVNVGCIPKKLMHFAALCGQSTDDIAQTGWTLQKGEHSWEKMVQKIQMHIKKLNFGYKKELMLKKVDYKNKLAKIQGPNTIRLTGKGEDEVVTAKHILVAVGGRPSYPQDIKNARELSFTSDDLFQLKERPKKICVVGASFVALECAGFLKALGSDVTVLVRSILLRGFDQQMAKMIGDYMQAQGIKLKYNAVPKSLTKKASGKIQVDIAVGEDQICDSFDAVMFAIGRSPDTVALGLNDVGVKLDKGGKIIVNPDDSTNIPSIFAIGDCSSGRIQLTPPAIMAGKLLAQRLFRGSKVLMDYKNIPVTVFTPIQYGSCGYTQEDAKKDFSEEKIICYVSKFKPLQWNFSQKRDVVCYCKLVVHKDSDKVLGLHYLGPHAGQVTQGYAVAIKMGVTKAQFDSTVGIHPTISEEFTILSIIRGVDDEEKKGC